MKKDFNVVYDANFSVGHFRGMGKYINNFICVLADIGYNTTGLLKPRHGIKDLEKFKVFGSRVYIFWEQFSLPLFLMKFGGIKIFPYNTAPLLLRPSKRDVLILHDLIFMTDFRSGALRQRFGALYRRIVVSAVVRRFNHIITVSEYSKRQIITRFKVDEGRISVIPNTIEVSESDLSLNPLFATRQNYILHIGGEPSYKNSKSVLFAYSLLSTHIKSRLRIKILGIRNKAVLREFIKTANILGIMDKVDFLGHQTDQDVAALYRDAKMFIFPSLEEGFGIPIIESYKYGCPLVCSNTSCLPEIAGSAATYFDPNSHQSIAEAINHVLTDSTDVESKIKLGYKRVLDFSEESFKRRVNLWLADLKADF